MTVMVEDRLIARTDVEALLESVKKIWGSKVQPVIATLEGKLEINGTGRPAVVLFTEKEAEEITGLISRAIGRHIRLASKMFTRTIERSGRNGVENVGPRFAASFQASQLAPELHDRLKPFRPQKSEDAAQKSSRTVAVATAG